jgi:hypothetical protein
VSDTGKPQYRVVGWLILAATQTLSFYLLIAQTRPIAYIYSSTDNNAETTAAATTTTSIETTPAAQQTFPTSIAK